MLICGYSWEMESQKALTLHLPSTVSLEMPITRHLNPHLSLIGPSRPANHCSVNYISHLVQLPSSLLAQPISQQLICHPHKSSWIISIIPPADINQSPMYTSFNPRVLTRLTLSSASTFGSICVELSLYVYIQWPYIYIAVVCWVVHGTNFNILPPSGLIQMYHYVINHTDGFI